MLRWRYRDRFQASGLGSSTIEERMRMFNRLAAPRAIVPFMCAAALALAPAAGVTLSAQSETGSVAGEVSGRSMRVAGAAVRIDGTRISATTGEDGRYRLTSVPSGRHTLIVTRLGYASRRFPITVTAGGETTQDVTLEPSVVALEEVIVTGTAGATERRAIGNAVSTISAIDEASKSAAPDLSNLLRARAPGVDVLAVSGRVGAGPSIQVRGPSSMGLGNIPLLYVDGVRIDNAVGRTIGGAGGLATQGASVGTRINDINPQDIESIEIIKGPAAATIYGTEATNGVVQIITKKGTSTGKARTTLQIVNGVMSFRDYLNRIPTNLMDSSGTIVAWNGARQEADSGRPLFKNGQERHYLASVTGGRDQLRYYVSLGYQNDYGVEPNNSMRQASTHANVGVPVNVTTDVNVSVNFLKNLAHLGHDAGASTMLNTIGGHRRVYPAFRGFFSGPPEVPQQLYDNVTDVSHFTGGITLNNNLTPWFTQRGIVGMDYMGEDARAIERFAPPALQPFLSAAAAAGRIGQTLRRNALITGDYSGTATFAVTPALQSAFSVGGQYNRSDFNQSFLGGQGFAAAGLETISGTATPVAASQNVIVNTTIGAYAQEQLAWKDRLYVTAAMRVDNNSAFGEDFDWVTYPKGGVSWVVSEEPFWRWSKWVNTLRLRTAYGESGRQPATFSALRTFTPVTGPSGSNAVTPGSFGNAELKPERGKEWEIGFEAGLFDRFGLEFTHFSKRTIDAIVSQAAPPSSGFPGSRLVNLGRVDSRGIEMRVTYDMTLPGDVDWSIVGNLGTAENEIKKNVTNVVVSPGLQNVEGYPINGFWARRVVSATFNTTTRAVENILCDGGTAPGAVPVACAAAPFVYIGRSTPNVFGSLSNSFNIGQSLRLYGLLDTRRGHRLWNQNETIRCIGLTGGRFCEANHYPERFSPLLLANYTPTAFTPLGTIDQHFQDATFIKLRELSATWFVPARFTRRFGEASITLAGRELATWTDYRGIDPESATGTATGAIDQAIIPPLTRFTATLNLSW
jgi:TonB-linked SusC/RagA family outer membrane protein